jgi:CDP-diacylglycerol--serine O-phosphatidyltransferase
MKVTRSVIPNLFTITNLFCGFSSMVHTLEGDYKTACIMIVVGGIFDALDGVMARLTNSSSEFGVELDSLADVVSFGLAPSLLVYGLTGRYMNPPGMLLAATPAICGALRLARFNVQLVGFDKNYFRGLPIPSAAFLIVSYVYFYFDGASDSVLVNGFGLMGITIIVSLLMVSTIKYDTIPKFTRKAVAAHPFKFASFVAGLTLAIVTLGKAIFPLMALYILAGAVVSFVTYVRKKTSAEEDPSLFDDESTQEIVS